MTADSSRFIHNIARFDRTIVRFDAANAEDPSQENFEGTDYPKELLYAQRMTAWLDRLAPDAPETLRLAVAACRRLTAGGVAGMAWPIRFRNALARLASRML